MNIALVELAELLEEAEHKNGVLVLFTSNLGVKADGSNVMGAGTAKAVKERYRGIPYEYGAFLGQPVETRRIWISAQRPWIGAFPVKPKNILVNRGQTNIVRHMRKQFKPLTMAPGYAAKADPRLIRKTWRSLVRIAENYKAIWVPAFPGTGNGGLDRKAGIELVPDPLPGNIGFYTNQK